MKTSRQVLGSWGESLAADYLSQRGYKILERNVRTPYGEIDLVARQDIEKSSQSRPYARASEGVIVFVEVKTRSSTTYGMPEQSITARKRDHMIASAQAYLQDHPKLGDDWRVDVIAIQRESPKNPPVITHFENALAGIAPGD